MLLRACQRGGSALEAVRRGPATAAGAVRGITDFFGGPSVPAGSVKNVRDPILTQESEGLEYACNWSLGKDGVAVEENAYRQARPALLAAKMGVRLEAGDAVTEVPVADAGTDVAVQVAGEGDLSFDAFAQAFGEVKTQLSGTPDLYVEDGSVVGQPTASTGLRLVTDQAWRVLPMRNVMFPTPLDEECNHNARFAGWNLDGESAEVHQIVHRRVPPGLLCIAQEWYGARKGQRPLTIFHHSGAADASCSVQFVEKDLQLASDERFEMVRHAYDGYVMPAGAQTIPELDQRLLHGLMLAATAVAEERMEPAWHMQLEDMVRDVRPQLDADDKRSSIVDLVEQIIAQPVYAPDPEGEGEEEAPRPEGMPPPEEVLEFVGLLKPTEARTVGANILARGNVSQRSMMDAVAMATAELMHDDRTAERVFARNCTSLASGDRTTLAFGDSAAHDILVPRAYANGSLHGALHNVISTDGVSAVWDGAVVPRAVAKPTTPTIAMNSSDGVFTKVSPLNMCFQASNIVFMDADAPSKPKEIPLADAVKRFKDQHCDEDDEDKAELFQRIMQDAGAKAYLASPDAVAV